MTLLVLSRIIEFKNSDLTRSLGISPIDMPNVWAGIHVY